MSLESTERPETLANELGTAISELSSYEAFEEAKAAVEDSEELQAQISEFEQLREEFMLARQAGEATQEDVRTVSNAQEALHENETMAAFLDAREALQTELESLNQAISAPLTIDFGEEAGGCCQE